MLALRDQIVTKAGGAEPSYEYLETQNTSKLGVVTSLLVLSLITRRNVTKATAPTGCREDALD
jgi:hypothetical protein